MPHDSTWTARLAAGPLDGATVRLDVDDDDLPDEVVMSFGMRVRSAELAWHSYALDRSRSVFGYLGENRLVDEGEEEDEDEPGSGLSPDAASEGSVEAEPADHVTRRFYELLFERHPHVRPMFHADIGPQSTALRRAVHGVLDHLDDPDWLVNVLGSLGARHARLGVSESMYSAFVDCMLTAMAEAAGTEWTPEHERVWRDTLDDITELMLAGSSPPA